MNVLIYFGNQLSPTSGGTERVACLIADGLSEDGHNVMYMASSPSSGKDGRQCAFLPEAIDAPSKKNIAFVRDYISKHRIDVVINEGASTDSIYLFSHEHIPQEVKIISHLHFNVRGDIDSFYRTQYLPLWGVGPFKAIVNLLKRIKMPYNRWRSLRNKRHRYSYMHQNSDKIVVLSPRQVALMEKLISASGSPKIEAIANPLTFAPSQANAPQKKEKIALFVGRLDYASKRVDRILKAWKMARPSMPGWTLKIVGDGSDMERLKNLSKKFCLESVEFVGKSDSRAYYETASLLLLASNYEGTPMVIPEAMTYGVIPIVMNNFTDASWLIKDGYNGILTPPFDISAMAHAIIRISEDNELSNAMRDNCKRSISEFYSNYDGLGRWSKLIME